MSRDVAAFLRGTGLLSVAVAPFALLVALVAVNPGQRPEPARPAPAVDWQPGFWGEVHPAARTGIRTPLDRGVSGGR